VDGRATNHNRVWINLSREARRALATLSINEYRRRGGIYREQRLERRTSFCRTERRVAMYWRIHAVATCSSMKAVLVQGYVQERINPLRQLHRFE